MIVMEKFLGPHDYGKKLTIMINLNIHFLSNHYSNFGGSNSFEN